MRSGRDMDLATGYDIVDTDVVCVLTRFELRSAWLLPKFIYWYYKVRLDARSENGLIQAVLLFEDFRTCYSLSIWKDESAIVHFNTKCRVHVPIANMSFGLLRIDKMGPHLWSAQFRLHALSPHNLHWDGMAIDHAFREQNKVRRSVRDVASKGCLA